MLFLIRILSRLPLSLLYFIADVLVYPLMYYVVRYRRAIVTKNMRMSFPDRSDEQRQGLERQFYRRFASTIMEIIYGYRIRDEEMRERFVFENVEVVEKLAHRNKGVFFMLGHLLFSYLVELLIYSGQNYFVLYTHCDLFLLLFHNLYFNFFSVPFYLFFRFLLLFIFLTVPCSLWSFSSPKRA